MEHTEENIQNIGKTNTNLKTAVVVLSILALFTTFGLYKYYIDANAEKEKTAYLENDRSKITAKLLQKNADLNKAIDENASKSEELKVERQKIVDLITEVNSKNAKISSLQAYKRKAEMLESRMDAMIQEIATLKRQNQVLTVQRDSSVAALNAYKTSAAQLVSGPNGFNNKNKIESNTTTSSSNSNGFRRNMSPELAEKLYRLDIANLSVQPLNENEAVTQNANDVDQIKVSYTIPQSFVVIASERSYYIQITDASGKIIGDNETANFENGVNLNYSSIKKVNYKNRVLPVTENFKYNNLKKGKYTFKIFDKGRLVGTKEFILK